MKYLFILALLFSQPAFCSDTTKLYRPYANAEQDVAQLLQQAKNEKKHVLLQIGGNWCVLCYRFNALVQTDAQLKQILENSFVVYHLNYSKENKNLAYLKKLGYPQRFGFPVLVVLDGEGNRLHTQDGSLLQKGNGYDAEKVKSFLVHWSPAAFLEARYKE